MDCDSESESEEEIVVTKKVKKNFIEISPRCEGEGELYIFH